MLTSCCSLSPRTPPPKFQESFLKSPMGGVGWPIFAMPYPRTFDPPLCLTSWTRSFEFRQLCVMRMSFIHVWLSYYWHYLSHCSFCGRPWRRLGWDFLQVPPATAARLVMRPGRGPSPWWYTSCGIPTPERPTWIHHSLPIFNQVFQAGLQYLWLIWAYVLSIGVFNPQ